MMLEIVTGILWQDEGANEMHEAEGVELKGQKGCVFGVGGS